MLVFNRKCSLVSGQLMSHSLSLSKSSSIFILKADFINMFLLNQQVAWNICSMKIGVHEEILGTFNMGILSFILISV